MWLVAIISHAMIPWLDDAHGDARGSSGSHGSTSACQRCELPQLLTTNTLDGPRTVPQIQARCPCEQKATNLLIDVGTSSDASDMLGWYTQNRSRRIIGFEPLPDNCARVRSKMAKARARRFDGHAAPAPRFECKAVGHAVGTMNLVVSGEQGSAVEKDASSYQDQATRISVPITTIDAEVGADDHVWVLKIDVQGGEVDVLRGAKRLLAERRVSWIYPEFDVMALHGLRSSAADLLNLLEANDFSCVNSRQRNGHRALGYVGELKLTFQGEATNATFCGYHCPCRYTNLLCGSHRVAVPVPGWKAALLEDFCLQPLCSHKSRRLERGICEAGKHAH